MEKTQIKGSAIASFSGGEKQWNEPNENTLQTNKNVKINGDLQVSTVNGTSCSPGSGLLVETAPIKLTKLWQGTWPSSNSLTVKGVSNYDIIAVRYSSSLILCTKSATGANYFGILGYHTGSQTIRTVSFSISDDTLGLFSSAAATVNQTAHTASGNHGTATLNNITEIYGVAAPGVKGEKGDKGNPGQSGERGSCFMSRFRSNESAAYALTTSATAVVPMNGLMQHPNANTNEFTSFEEGIKWVGTPAYVEVTGGVLISGLNAGDRVYGQILINGAVAPRGINLAVTGGAYENPSGTNIFRVEPGDIIKLGSYNATAARGSVSATSNGTFLTAKLIAYVEFFIVTFLVDGNEYVTRKVEDGKTIGASAMPSMPTKTGYTFLRWENQSQAFTATTIIDKDTTVDAVFEAIMHTVTFVVDGVTYSTFQVQEGSMIGAQMPNDPTKPGGWQFNAWKSGSNTITNTTVINGNMNATAEWKALYYTIDFIVEGVPYATIQVQQTTAIGSKMPKNPKKSGYSFDGWYDGATKITLSSIPAGNMTVVAKFSVVDYVDAVFPPRISISNGCFSCANTVEIEGWKLELDNEFKPKYVRQGEGGTIQAINGQYIIDEPEDWPNDAIVIPDLSKRTDLAIVIPFASLLQEWDVLYEETLSYYYSYFSDEYFATDTPEWDMGLVLGNSNYVVNYTIADDGYSQWSMFDYNNSINGIITLAQMTDASHYINFEYYNAANTNAVIGDSLGDRAYITVYTEMNYGGN